MKKAVSINVKKRVIKEPLFLKLKMKEKREERNKPKQTCYDKTMQIIDFPFVWIRRLTILPCEPHSYDKYYTIVWPYFGILATEMIVMKSWPTSIHFFFYLPIAVLWSVLFYCKQGTVDYEKEQE
jgi:hypothetical protein